MSDDNAEQYSRLSEVLTAALYQAAEGKGKVRHATSRPFQSQPSMEIGRMVGLGYPLGQAMKKAQETTRLVENKDIRAARAEILGAINYLAMAYLLLEE